MSRGSKAWAEQVIAQQDYLPWRDVEEARRVLGLPAEGMTAAEREAYEKGRARREALLRSTDTAHS